MNGPCLCGDLACGRCFPSGQTPVRCVQKDCGWKGRRHECGSEELSEGIVDTCPECGCDCEEQP
jgi:hypothetical protein